MSNFAHGEKADQYATKRMRDEYEAMIAELKVENKSVKEANALKTEENRSLQSKLVELNSKNDLQAKEIERLQMELKKKDKQHDDKIKNINKQNAGLFEQVGKLKKEITNLKQDLNRK